MSELPRGVRNHNPGNLRHGQQWEGLAAEQTDPDFCQFTDAVHGIRALCIVLLAYQERHGMNTLRAMIARWAPAGDHNSPSAYALAVAKFMRVGRDDVLNLRACATLAKMATGIIRVECGDYTYDPAIVNQAVSLAYEADNIPAVLSPAADPRQVTPASVPAGGAVAGVSDSVVYPPASAHDAADVTTAELNAMEATDPAALPSVGIKENTVSASASADAGTDTGQ